MQSALSRLDNEEILKFKSLFHKSQPGNIIQQVMEGDLLDFVDKAIEIHGEQTELWFQHQDRITYDEQKWES